MKEYRIVFWYGDDIKNYRCIGGTYTELITAQIKLIDIVRQHKKEKAKSRQAYYVVNDFYNNEFPPHLKNIKKYCIQ